MKISFFIFLTVLIKMNIALARKVGETEITTDDGIEVFQNEKYLLNTNVKLYQIVLNYLVIKLKFL